MQTDIALRTLEQLGDGILSHMAAAECLTRDEPASARVPLAAARWSLVRRLRAFQLFKRTEIFGPALRRGDPDRAVAARRLADRCAAAGESFDAYVRYWSGQDVVERWDDYRPAMLGMTARLRRDVLGERLQVARLLDGTGRTRLPRG